jgi:hypothetical protein
VWGEGRGGGREGTLGTPPHPPQPTHPPFAQAPLPTHRNLCLCEHVFLRLLQSYSPPSTDHHRTRGKWVEQLWGRGGGGGEGRRERGEKGGRRRKAYTLSPTTPHPHNSPSPPLPHPPQFPTRRDSFQAVAPAKGGDLEGRRNGEGGKGGGEGGGREERERE